MKKSYVVQFIGTDISMLKPYEDIIHKHIERIELTTDLYETFDFYHNAKPDMIILGSNKLYSDYEPFLKKVKRNYSTPVIIFIQSKELIDIASSLNYNFSYAILDDAYEQHIDSAMKTAVLKVRLIEKMLSGYNQKFSTLEKNKAIIENSHIPTLITTGHIKNLKCNKAFLKHFNLTQLNVNTRLDDPTFIDSDALKKLLTNKYITRNHTLKVNGKLYDCKIYTLKKYELFLITFESLFSGNKLIDLNLKKELETMLHRIDKNFDDYVRLQYNMIELSSQIQGFLHLDTDTNLIDEWLISNKKIVEAIESELDSNILEELKISCYVNI